MKVYVTKYALTRGILLMEVVETGYFAMVKKNQNYYHADEYFLTESEAIKDTEQRKEKKLIQLQNQLAKLENKNVTIIKEV